MFVDDVEFYSKKIRSRIIRLVRSYFESRRFDERVFVSFEDDDVLIKFDFPAGSDETNFSKKVQFEYLTNVLTNNIYHICCI